VIKDQLEAHQIIIKKGALVDASVVDTPLKPKERTNFNVTKDREDENEVKVDKDYPDSVDKEVSTLKKADKYRYGYKTLLKRKKVDVMSHLRQTIVIERLFFSKVSQLIIKA
jgi:hypothetical protein